MRTLWPPTNESGGKANGFCHCTTPLAWSYTTEVSGIKQHTYKRKENIVWTEPCRTNGLSRSHRSPCVVPVRRHDMVKSSRVCIPSPLGFLSRGALCAAHYGSPTSNKRKQIKCTANQTTLPTGPFTPPVSSVNFSNTSAECCGIRFSTS